MLVNKAAVPHLFELYGAAIFEAQHLERGIGLLLDLMKTYEHQVFPDDALSSISGPKPYKTLKPLFNTLLEKHQFSDADQTLLNHAIEKRNLLVHRYWSGARMEAVATSKGSEWLEADLRKLHQQMRDAGRLIDRIIDAYLSMYSTSLDQLVNTFESQWEDGDYPPEQTLH